eukprot:4590717-Pyramimonas_sp.AAC.1
MTALTLCMTALTLRMPALTIRPYLWEEWSGLPRLMTLLNPAEDPIARGPCEAVSLKILASSNAK